MADSIQIVLLCIGLFGLPILFAWFCVSTRDEDWADAAQKGEPYPEWMYKELAQARHRAELRQIGKKG